MRAMFSYFGSKWSSVDRYPRPMHSVIVEPFAGGASYSTRWFKRRVVLIDKDPLVADLWRWLIAAGRDDVLALPSDVDDVRGLDCAPAAKALIGFGMNHATTSPRNKPTAWAKESRGIGYWGESRKRLIAEQVEQIKHWSASHGSYVDAPDIEATWFVDPPYSTDNGDHYRYRKIDYSLLGEWCMSRKGTVIVCEQAGAKWLPFRELGQLPTKMVHKMRVNNEAVCVIVDGRIVDNTAQVVERED